MFVGREAVRDVRGGRGGKAAGRKSNKKRGCAKNRDASSGTCWILVLYCPDRLVCQASKRRHRDLDSFQMLCPVPETDDLTVDEVAKGHAVDLY